MREEALTPRTAPCSVQYIVHLLAGGSSTRFCLRSSEGEYTRKTSLNAPLRAPVTLADKQLEGQTGQGAWGGYILRVTRALLNVSLGVSLIPAVRCERSTVSIQSVPACLLLCEKSPYVTRDRERSHSVQNQVVAAHRAPHDSKRTTPGPRSTPCPKIPPHPFLFLPRARCPSLPPSYGSSSRNNFRLPKAKTLKLADNLKRGR